MQDSTLKIQWNLVNKVQTVQKRASSEMILLEGLKKGERVAQKKFYEQQYGKMMSIAMRYASSKEDAYEIVNTGFYKVFKSIHQYTEKGSFGAWVATIVKRTAIDHCRKNKFKTTHIDEWSENESTIENEAYSNIGMQELYKLIQDLPNATRTVFNMYVVDGYKHHEIAGELGISEGTSKWHLSQARKLLQKMIVTKDNIK